MKNVCKKINDKLGAYITPCTVLGAILVIAIIMMLRSHNTVVIATPVKTKESFRSPSFSDYPAVFTMYKVDWCPHCKKAAPEWNKMKSTVKEMGMDVKIEEIDGDKEASKAKAAGVKAFPTMIYKRGTEEIKYDGPRDADSLIEFVDEMASRAPSAAPRAPSAAPRAPSRAPSAAPRAPTMAPSMAPSMAPFA